MLGWLASPAACSTRHTLRFLVASPFSSLAGRSQVLRKEPLGEKASS